MALQDADMTETTVDANIIEADSASFDAKGENNDESMETKSDTTKQKVNGGADHHALPVETGANNETEAPIESANEMAGAACELEISKSLEESKPTVVSSGAAATSNEKADQTDSGAAQTRETTLKIETTMTSTNVEEDDVPFTNKAQESNKDVIMSLSSPLDSALSPLHRYIRLHCVEYFIAESENQVGLRCVFCKNVKNKAKQSIIFPEKLEEICAAVLVSRNRLFCHIHVQSVDVFINVVTLFVVH